MGMFDTLKKKLEDKIVDTFGGEPLPTKESPKSNDTPMPEQSNLDNIDVTAFMDESKLGSSVFEQLTATPTVEEVLTEEPETEDEINFRPMSELLLDGAVPGSILEEQCGCKVFFRNVGHEELFIEECLSKHSQVTPHDKAEVVLSVIESAKAEDDDTPVKVFVGYSSMSRNLYNFKFNGTLDVVSYVQELKQYLERRVEDFGLTYLFYISESVVHRKTTKHVIEEPFIITTNKDTVLYNVRFCRSDNQLQRLGIALDLSSEEDTDGINEYNAELVELMISQMKQQMFPNTVRTFKLDDKVTLRVDVSSWLEDTDVEELARRVEHINRSYRKWREMNNAI